MASGYQALAAAEQFRAVIIAGRLQRRIPRIDRRRRGIPQLRRHNRRTEFVPAARNQHAPVGQQRRRMPCTRNQSINRRGDDGIGRDVDDLAIRHQDTLGVNPPEYQERAIRQYGRRMTHARIAQLNREGLIARCTRDRDAIAHLLCNVPADEKPASIGKERRRLSCRVRGNGRGNLSRGD